MPRQELWNNDWCARANSRAGVSFIGRVGRGRQLAMLELLKNNSMHLNSESMLECDRNRMYRAREKHQMLNRTLWYDVLYLRERVANLAFLCVCVYVCVQFTF